MGRRLPSSAFWVMGSAGQARALMRLVGGPIQTGMQEPSKSLPRVGSRLFAAYAAASLIPVVLLGAMLVRGSQREALESGLEQGRAQAAVIEEMAIAPALTGADLDHQLTAAERQRLQDATDLAIFNGSVIRLRLRGFRGRVVFSDNGSTAGALPTSHHAFRAAAVGRTDVAIVQDPDGASGRVIRVLQPVVAKATGQATGVLELYLPYSTIAEHVQAQMRRTFWRLAVGLAALYAVLAFIAWSTTRRLRRHATQHQHEALHDALTGLPQPQMVPGTGRGHRRGRPAWLPRSDRPRRPGPLQGRQRHPRPPRGRRAAARRRPAAACLPAHR
jgi:diguanylate cyclase